MAKKTTTTTKTKTSTKENAAKVDFTITDESSIPAPAGEPSFPHGFESSPTTLDFAKIVHTAEDLEKFGIDEETGEPLVDEKDKVDEAIEYLKSVANQFDNAHALKEYRKVFLKKYNEPIERNVDSDINALLGILINYIKTDCNAKFIYKLTSENYDKLFTAFKNALYLSEILFGKSIHADIPVDTITHHMHGYAEYESEAIENDTIKTSVRVYPRLSIAASDDDSDEVILRYTPSIVRSVIEKNNPEAEPEVRTMIPGEVVVKFSTLTSKIKYSVNSNCITEEFGNIFDILKHVTYLEEKTKHMDCLHCQKRCTVPDCCFLYEDRAFIRRRDKDGKEISLDITAKIKNGNVKVSNKVVALLRANEFVKEDILCFVQTRLCN
jgi:hypothetical protein